MHTEKFEDCDYFYNKLYDPRTNEYTNINASLSMDELNDFKDYL